MDRNNVTFPQTSGFLLSLAQDLQAFSELAKKLQKKLLLLAQTKTAVQDEEIEQIDDPETIKSIGKSLEDYKAGRYTVLKTPEDIDRYIAGF